MLRGDSAHAFCALNMLGEIIGYASQYCHWSWANGQDLIKEFAGRAK